MKNDIVKGAVILVIAGIIGKILGAVYRIPLSNILGAEGIGIYQMIFPVFSLALIISSSGVSANIAKSVAHVRAENMGSIKKIFFNGFLYSLIVGFIFSILLFLFAENIAYVQGNELATLGYKVMALALVFASLLAPFRGLFQGYQNMTPTAVSQIVEQIFKVALGLVLAFIFAKQSMELGVVGAFLGITFAEIVAFVYLVIKFLKFRKNNKNIFQSGLSLKPSAQKIALNLNADTINKKTKAQTELGFSANTEANIMVNSSLKTITSNLQEQPSSLSQELSKTLKMPKQKSFLIQNFTFTLSFLIIPLITAFDSFVVINLLNKNFTESFSTSLYGLQSGLVNSLINFPVIISVAISLALLPSLTYLLAQNKKSEASEKIKKIFSLLWIIILPCIVVFVMLAPLIMNVLYGDIEPYLLEVSSILLQISAVQILFISVLQISVAIFQSVGKEKVPVGIMSIAAILKVGLTIVLVSSTTFNIYGLALANLVFYAFSAILSLNLIKRDFKFTLSIKLLGVTTASSLILAASFYALNVLSLGILAKINLIIVFGICLYILPLFVFKILNFSDLKEMIPHKKENKKKVEEG